MGNEIPNVEKMRAGADVSREIASIIQTENVGWLVSISRALKTGKTASEITTFKMEAHAKDKQTALETFREIDTEIMRALQLEAQFFGVELNMSKAIKE